MAHTEDAGSKASFFCSETKKNIFLIGDSIRKGYCSTVKEELSDVAEVFYVDDNCRNTQYVITCLYGWSTRFSDPSRVDLVQFNCGHWDTAHWFGAPLPLTSEQEYQRNIGYIIDQLRKLFPNAEIVFATTTTMNPKDDSSGRNPRSTVEIARYNELAVKVAAEKGVAVHDLFSVTKDWDASCYADYCHFTAETNQRLGHTVAELLRKRI